MEKECACKGIRTCLVCEHVKTASLLKEEPGATSEPRVYQYDVQRKCCINKMDSYDVLSVAGIFVIEEFLTENEENELVQHIDRIPWVDSQSGRRKQDFGPKVNFKRQKVKLDCFTGLPPFSRDIVPRILAVEELKDFQPVEQCHLDYNPSRGSAIDPHIDDCWLWGPRLVTLNLLSDTFLTLSRDTDSTVVEIPCRRRSLLVLAGDSRYKWKHSIQREHIQQRRVAITLRELSDKFLPPNGEDQTLGKHLIETALTFEGVSVAEFDTASKQGQTTYS